MSADADLRELLRLLAEVCAEHDAAVRERRGRRRPSQRETAWRNRQFVTVVEAAAILGVSAPTVLRRIRAGRLPAEPLNRRTWLVRRSDVERLAAVEPSRRARADAS